MTYPEFLAAKRQRMKNSTYIYALVDPFTDEIRYVGKSIRPGGRLHDHCNDTSNTHRVHWVQSVISRGGTPKLVILEVLSRSDDWQAAERHWIRLCKERGARLVNGTSGGDGVTDLSPESRARITAAWIGRKHKPETLAKIGAASRERRWTPERREHMRALMSGRRITWNDKLARATVKLTDDQVRAIRREFSAGVLRAALAERYGVHRGTITKVTKRQGYAWVPDEADLGAADKETA